MPDNFATIDHLNTRLIYPEGRPGQGKQVLACNSCNKKRNEQEMAAQPLEELWKRAKRSPESMLKALPAVRRS